MRLVPFCNKKYDVSPNTNNHSTKNIIFILFPSEILP
jgi:hypothetical protein